MMMIYHEVIRLKNWDYSNTSVGSYTSSYRNKINLKNALPAC
jgi:hypothetical protein